jgi:hypothetical protein
VSGRLPAQEDGANGRQQRTRSGDQVTLVPRWEPSKAVSSSSSFRQPQSIVPSYSEEEERTMRNVLVKLAATVGVIAPVATAGVVPAGALGVYFGQPHHGYYSYHGSALKWHGCRPGRIRQRNVCKPYQWPGGTLPIRPQR